MGLQTFAYFSGIPWEDPPSTGTNSEVSDAVVLSYVSYSGNGPFLADTINYYNSQDSKTNKIYHGNFDEYSPIGNQNIGINVGGDTYLPLNFPIFMYEYGWTSGGSGAGYSSGYYVGILKNIDILGLGYFLTTQYTNNPNPSPRGYYDYYYSGSANGGSNYYFLEDNNSNGNNNIQGHNGGSQYFPFMPLDQQLNQPLNQPYSQYGLFWLYNWFQEENNNNMNVMNIYFLMNGNIFNYSLASEQYNWECGCVFFICFTCSAYAIPPNPPANTINGEPIFAQSYINAYNTAFNQPNNNYQKALNEYSLFSSTSQYINSNFIPGTFGSKEEYNNKNNGETFYINYLTENPSNYIETPYLFVSAGSYGGSGYMYLDWIIVTYGVPYVASVS